MYNAKKPDLSELPTTNRLLKSTGLAVVVAAGLLVTVVLPAEYGLDPTRVGSVLGLTEMGRIKQALAAEAEAEEALAAAPAEVIAAASVTTPTDSAKTGEVQTVTGRSDTTVITLAPDQGAEIKLVMSKGGVARYQWASSGGKVNFDTHGDGKGIKYHPYGKGSEAEVSGDLTAAFDGSHGWFWRNRTGEPVTITLKTAGAYTEVKRVV
jgi:hypothetical protein